MANWKIQDIAPPKKFKKQVEEPLKEPEPQKQGNRKKTQLPRWFKRGFLPFLVLLVFVFGTVHVFFATAEVVVRPQTRQVKLLESVSAEVGRQRLDKEELILPARTLTVEKRATRLFDASSTTIKEDRAKGIIRVYNATDSAKTLVAQTRFVSEQGILFRTTSRITIPGSSEERKLVPGFLDVEVVAAEPGEEYNIGASNFSLPGLSGSVLFTAIYGVSTAPMTGGSEREISVVSQDDIEKAKQALIGELTMKAANELLSQVPEYMIATEDSIVVEVSEASSLVEAGAELDQFNVTVSLNAVAYLFPRADVDTLVETFLASELGEKERVPNDKTRISFQQITVDTDTVTLQLSIQATLYQYTDPTELKIKLRGKSEKEANDILTSYVGLKEAKLSLWPFWISSVPGNVDKLKIEVIVD